MALRVHRPSGHAWLAGRERSFQCMSATPLTEYPFWLLRLRPADQGWLEGRDLVRCRHSRKTKSRPGGIDFIEQELMEFSIVSVPANAEALMELSAADKAQLRRMRELELIR
jgi:hypothetical protein